MNIEDTYHFRFSDFGPSEVARVTGISQDKQRDWRRRGIIVASGDGSHARFNSLHVAQLMVRQSLSDVGIDLMDSAKLAGLAAVMVLEHAERSPGAIEAANDVPSDVVDHVTQERSEPPVLRYLVAFHPQVNTVAIDDETTRAAAERYFGKFGSVAPARTIEDAAGMAEAFQKHGFGLAWSLIDLMALGQRFAKMAERPIMQVVMGASSGPNPTIQRIVGHSA